MRCAACCPSCSAKTDPAAEELLLTPKARKTPEVVLASGCHCFLGDPLLVLLPEWKEACHPFGHHLSLQTQVQYLESKKKAHQ